MPPKLRLLLRRLPRLKYSTNRMSESRLKKLGYKKMTVWASAIILLTFFFSFFFKPCKNILIAYGDPLSWSQLVKTSSLLTYKIPLSLSLSLSLSDHKKRVYCCMRVLQYCFIYVLCRTLYHNLKLARNSNLPVYAWKVYIYTFESAHEYAM